MGDVIGEDELAAFHRTVGRLRELPVDDPVRPRAEQVAASFACDGRLRRRKTRGAETAAADAGSMAATATGARDRRPRPVPATGARTRRWPCPATRASSVSHAIALCASRPCRQVDAFSHRLGPRCAADNTARRALTTDLEGRRALLTGGRVKIGFQLALMMLRDGAELLVTSRFPPPCADSGPSRAAIGGSTG
ncbi:hypothetical protein [Streptomyces canus]|uniref:hypothetical protein n=1 Tax=Streptomyces canus TaxID=58343 RepID=UPI0027803B74|nr:hypothetical protein [Streptomyces canus]